MRYFDLHCDTLYKAMQEKSSFNDSSFHISLDKAKDIKTWIQCFAIWIPDDKNSDEAVDLVYKAHKQLLREINKSDGKIIQCSSREDLENVCANEKIGAVFCIEGSRALGGDIENLSRFYDLGVKIITLTWNDECDFGSGILAKCDKGITAYGKKALEEMNKIGIIPDVSHSSEKLFYDVAKYSEKVIIATHSNSKQICRHKRNLSDEQFSVIRDRNGVVGLNFYSEFLNDTPSKSSVEDVFAHAEHFMSLGGEDIVCIGGDFDGADMPSDINGIESIYNVANCLLRHNYSEKLVNKILFDNAYDFFMRHLK